MSTMDESIRFLKEFHEAEARADEMIAQHEVKVTEWAKKILLVLTSMMVFGKEEDDVIAELEDAVRKIMTDW